MNLCINQLFQWNNEGARIERILWIEDAGHCLVTIDVTDKQAWPSFIERSFLERHITDGSIHLLDTDMNEYLRHPDMALTLSDIEQREKAWRVIADIVAPQQEKTGVPDNGAIFQSPTLDLLVQTAVERTGCSKQWICTCLRRYWQRGHMKNALLPEIDPDDVSGKERQNLDHKTPKRGRPSNIARLTGVATGINIDDTIKEYFRRGTELFYGHTERKSMIRAFDYILTLFFHQGTELRNGKFVPLLPPASERPTWNQYRYWYRKEYDPVNGIAASEGLHTSDMGGRSDLGSLRKMIPGPGFLFGIHAVIGDICLVSMLDRRRILGRPVMYIVVDLFSDLIVGMSVSLDGPHWEGAMLALENAAHDKVAFCKEYGVDITEDDWPCQHLPKAILPSRDELFSNQAHNLTGTLGIEVSNMALDCSGWKETFRRSIPILEDGVIHWEPRSVNNLPESRQKGYQLDACLTLYDFHRLMIYCVIEHNQAHRLSDDYLDRDMIADSVKPYPRDLWKWGIRNRPGMLRVIPLDIARRNLLSEAEASAISEGIYFRNMLYSLDEVIQNQRFEQAHTRNKRSRSTPIVYDPRAVDQIYMVLQGVPPIKACRLLEKDQKEFKGCTWFDIEDLITLYTSERVTRAPVSQQRVKHPVTRLDVSEEAQRRIREVVENRAAERVQEREMNLWEFQE